MKWLLFLTFIFPFNICFSQEIDYSWWNKKHNWDGRTPWPNYITLSPGFMGPNALPVPEVRGAIISDSAFFKVRYDQHGGFGDNTQNIFTELYVPVLKNKVAFNCWMVPFEKYAMDTITRDSRGARYESGKGTAIGDFCFASIINIFKEKKYLPATTLECTIKTASGNNLSNARFTDSPGYLFTVHSSKSIFKKEKYAYLINVNTGFYSWQTNKERHRQNDAFVYGLTLSMQHPSFGFSTGIKGYEGYINDGDRPVVFFANGYKNYGKIQLSLNLQYGVKDFPYQSVFFGISYYPSFLKKILSKYQNS